MEFGGDQEGENRSSRGRSSVEKQRNKSSSARNSNRERGFASPRELDFQAMSDIDSNDEQLGESSGVVAKCSACQSSSGSLEDDYDMLWQ